MFLQHFGMISAQTIKSCRISRDAMDEVAVFSEMIGSCGREIENGQKTNL